VPFWRGEAPARTDELSAHVADLREQIGSRVPRSVSNSEKHDRADFAEAVNWLMPECGWINPAPNKQLNMSLPDAPSSAQFLR